MSDLDVARQRIRACQLVDEARLIGELIGETGLDAAARQDISERAGRLVETVRASAKPGLMESFLAEYGLATEEGVALMSLAEALLRVPDSTTVDMLINDKVGASDWTAHFGGSKSTFVNFSTWALNLTADVLGAPEAGPRAPLQSAIKRLGEPVIRVAVSQAMRLLGAQFVFGRNIAEAIKQATTLERAGFRFSYDMLGEAARTAADAERYTAAYAGAIEALAAHCRPGPVRDNPGISVKLSALHPRYEYAKRQRMLDELVPRTLALAKAARAAGMGFNIDAEEAERLDLSLDVIEAVLADPALAGWDGFGVVVQAYGKRVLPLIDWLQALAQKHGRKLMVRLVKGAYWDAEIKRAQTLGLAGFPVFTRKAATDVSYIAAAKRLFEAGDVLYPQFATHNAHSAAAVLHLARRYKRGNDRFEFQRLHGMGEQLHAVLRQQAGTVCRIYAPVGPHKDLLAYLVRRLLENGANGSFVYQIADEGIPAKVVAEDPIARVLALGRDIANPAIAAPQDLFGSGRKNSAGVDLSDPVAITTLDWARENFRSHRWAARPLLAGQVQGSAPSPVTNPARTGDVVGTVVEATPYDIETALAAAASGFAAWSARPASDRAALLRQTADLYEANAPELYALLAREAGKTLLDCVSEVREAVDFLRYYAGEAEAHAGRAARGVFACISPWNFPLAIFTGQIAAGLGAGNAVIAKPAAQTPLIACRAVELMHAAGIPPAAIQLLPGPGGSVGQALTGDPRIAGTCFTGSLPTAKRIDANMAENLAPEAPLIAETGGLNAMIVDSTALPEQAVRDILASAFQSAGQRCSALRILYVQEEAAERTIDMLKGAMDELALGDPWPLATDIGPVIDATARDKISGHVEAFRQKGRLIKQLAAPDSGIFVAPALLEASGVAEIEEEIFGPVLHVATYKANALDAVIEAINASGYGLTFGLHSRISSRVEAVARRIKAGNIYVNRNQIGAVVGSQPFGGEGLSGTGPKAGGPHYLPRFLTPADVEMPLPFAKTLELPGPTGETNRLSLFPRGTALCLGPGTSDIAAQKGLVEATGNFVETVDGPFDPARLETDATIDAVLYFGGGQMLLDIRRALSRRKGAILPLITTPAEADRLLIERHLCIDTTAAGGNASLMIAAAGA